MGDLPDWYTQVQSATLRATSLQGGIDADKSASPVAEDVYLARDTGILYVCFTSGTWTNIGTLYLLLAGGTMTGVIVFAAGQTGTYLLLAGGTMSGAIAMGTKKITGMGDPAAAQDAATKAYVDAVDAKLDDVTWAEPVRALDTIYQNTGGKIRLVTVQIEDANGGDRIKVQIGSATPPATQVGRIGLYATATAGGFFSITFIVPVNWYYRVATDNGSPQIEDWHEWDLF